MFTRILGKIAFFCFEKYGKFTIDNGHVQFGVCQARIG